jgi:hypothetical protein
MWPIKMRGGEDKMRRRLPILRPRGKGQRPLSSREKYFRDFEPEKQSENTSSSQLFALFKFTRIFLRPNQPWPKTDELAKD